MSSNINKHDILHNVAVIIRSAKERTINACHTLILQQGIPRANISFVEETPFAKALKRSYEAGIERGLKWTCCVDADVLLRQNSIRDIVDHANTYPESIFEIQGLVLDKFIGGPRPGGIHLYRTVLLPKALDLIPGEQDKLRPESGTIFRMSKLGHKWVKTSDLVGLHDYEQYNFDIFRKCFVHARKHRSLIQVFLNDWGNNMKNDEDFKVAYFGLLRGLEHTGKVHVDITQSIYKEEFDKLKIVEKNQLPTDDIHLSEIETIIKNYKPSRTFLEHEPSFAGFGVSQKDKIRKLIKKTGVYNTFLWLLGLSFKKMGERIIKRQIAKYS